MASRTVLFIDDELNVLKSVERLFRREDLELFTTADPQEAIRYVTEHETAVIVSDQRMPEMTGTHLLEKLREIRPESVRMTLTGYADKEAAIEAINLGAVHRFLTKPWDDADLKREVLRGVEDYNLRAEVKRLQAIALEQNEQLRELNSTLEQKVEERTADIARLNKDLRSSFMTSIAIMARLGEMHSPTVGSHSQRVATLAKEMAAEMKLPVDEASTVYAGALLHDIGKLGIPVTLLQKDQDLYTDKERATFRRHVVEGERLVAMVPSIRNAAPLVRGHHERWNGSGYPDGLAGEEIPLGARIIAVADAYDNALNHQTRFGNATPSTALQQVVKYSGTWFDPAAIKGLIGVLSKKDNATSNILEVNLRDLRPGMKLAAEIRTLRGVLLVANHTMITQPLIDRLTMFSDSDPIAGAIIIVRQTAEPERDTSETDLFAVLSRIAGKPVPPKSAVS